MKTITVDESGRIEIPPAICAQLGLYPRESLQIEMSEGRIILSPLNSATPYREGTALVVNTPPLGTIEDVNTWIDRIRDDRIQSQIVL